MGHYRWRELARSLHVGFLEAFRTRCSPDPANLLCISVGLTQGVPLRRFRDGWGTGRRLLLVHRRALVHNGADDW